MCVDAVYVSCWTAHTTLAFVRWRVYRVGCKFVVLDAARDTRVCALTRGGQELNVEAAHTELVKYLASASSNRWLMLKVFELVGLAG